MSRTRGLATSGWVWIIQIMAGIHRKVCRNKFKILPRKQLKWFKVTTGKMDDIRAYIEKNPRT